MTAHISGRELSRTLFEERVRPTLDASMPDLQYSAALLGRGSEVLGFDDAMSTDHDWQARVQIFLTATEYERRAEEVRQALSAVSSGEVQGWSTDVPVLNLREFVRQQLGLDIEAELTALDWVTLPEQRLCTFAAATIHHDDAGLAEALGRLHYYPDDVWRFLMIASWWRLHPEANLVGRVGSLGDDLGTSILTARLVHDLMRLCFLLERTYAPYPKWFGTAFSRLDCAPALTPVLSFVLTSPNWQARQEALLTAYGEVTRMHNALGITGPVTTEVVRIWDRPFAVLWGDFPEALLERITDLDVRRLAERWPMGEVADLRNQVWDPRRREDLLHLVRS